MTRVVSGPNDMRRCIGKWGNSVMGPDIGKWIKCLGEDRLSRLTPEGITIIFGYLEKNGGQTPSGFKPIAAAVH